MILELSVFGALAAAAVNADEWRAFAARVKAMFRLHDIPWTKGAVQYMGLNPGDFQRALDGTAKFDYRRVYMLPKDMRATLAFLELEAHGLPLWVQRAQAIAPAINHRQNSEVA